MTAHPVVYRVATQSPSPVIQSAEFRAENLEAIPYSLGESAGSTSSTTPGWPPPGFTGVPGITVPTQNTTSLLPQPYNIEWVQGDTAIFQFLFTDVLWTDTDPGFTDPEAPVWVNAVWNAQVRNPYIYSTYAADWWVPAYGYQYQWWRGHSIVANFTVTAIGLQLPNVVPARWGTEITMTLNAVNSAMILPGNWFRWDLQTRFGDALDQVNTHLRGKARVITEWTVA